MTQDNANSRRWFVAVLDTFWESGGRKEGPWWGHLLLLITFNAVIGAFIATAQSVFTGSSLTRALAQDVPISECIGFCIAGLHWLTDRWFGAGKIRGLRPFARAAYYIASSTLGVYLGLMGYVALVNTDASHQWMTFGTDRGTNRGALSFMLFTVGVSAVIYQLVSFHIQTGRLRLAAEQERARMLHMEKETATARLNTLQAQIEPHFLFNTLANVLAMMHDEPQQAAHMLEAFIEYLRSSLSVTRGAMTTVEREAAMIRHYLLVLSHRFGPRLQYEISLSDETLALPLPPMLLQPLVENAVRYGIESSKHGGFVRLQTRIALRELIIEVTDPGGPAGTGAGEGIGLANVRQRLELTYGKGATLHLDRQTNGVTIQRVSIPLVPS